MAFSLVSVVVPAYNEAASLEELFSRVDAVMDRLGQPYEFLVVDDGSEDATAEVVKSLSARHGEVGLVRHARNHGKSMALMQGFAMSRGDVVVTMDADLQDVPEDIPKVLAPLAAGYDLVGGWRKNRRDTWSKQLVSRVYNTLVHKISGFDFKDINCGFKAFTRGVADRLELTGDMHRLIPAIAVSYGFRTTEVPVSHTPRRYGTSRYRLLRHRGLLDILAFSVLRTTQVRPFHIMCEIGFGCLCLALALGLCVWGLTVFEPAFWREAARWVAALAGVGFGAIGLLCPMTGLIVECIVMNRQDSRWRDMLVRERLLPRVRETDAPTRTAQP